MIISRVRFYYFMWLVCTIGCVEWILWIFLCVLCKIFNVQEKNYSERKTRNIQSLLRVITFEEQGKFLFKLYLYSRLFIKI